MSKYVNVLVALTNVWFVVLVGIDANPSVYLPPLLSMLRDLSTSEFGTPVLPYENETKMIELSRCLWMTYVIWTKATRLVIYYIFSLALATLLYALGLSRIRAGLDDNRSLAIAKAAWNVMSMTVFALAVNMKQPLLY